MNVPPKAPSRVATNGRERTDRCAAQSAAKRTWAAAGASAVTDPSRSAWKLAALPGSGRSSFGRADSTALNFDRTGAWVSCPEGDTAPSSGLEPDGSCLVAGHRADTDGPWASRTCRARGGGRGGDSPVLLAPRRQPRVTATACAGLHQANFPSNADAVRGDQALLADHTA
jgi:hypothetical protein